MAAATRAPQLMHWILALLLILVRVVHLAHACTICSNEQDITLPEKSLTVPGYPFLNNCQSLQSIVSILAPESNDCAWIQSIGSICGCAVREDPCLICGVDSTATGLQNPTQLANVDISEFAGGSLTLPRLQPTCELVQAYLQSRSATESQCLEIQTLVAETCTCGDDTDTAGNTTTILDDEDSNTNTTTPIDNNNFPLAPQERCQLCRNWEDLIDFPDTDITGYVRDLSLDVLLGKQEEAWNESVVTCKDLYQAIPDTLASDSPICVNSWRKPFRGICGCPPVGNACNNVCSEGIRYPDVELSLAKEKYGLNISPTCADFELILRDFRESTPTCLAAKSYSYLCGCNDEVRNYLGATTKPKQAALAWVPRVTGCLSLIGSLLIIYNVTTSPKKRKSFYHQLVSTMSVFDVFGSLAWIVSTAPEPKYEPDIASSDVPTGIYGAIGTPASCTAQGFFFQLGYTGIFYNMVLTMYYVLVIKYGMRERRLFQLRWFFHVPVLVAGLGLAFAGIPYYEYLFFACHIPPPPLVDSSTLINLFSIAPISIVLIVSTMNMAIIYWHVHQQDKAANRWRMTMRANGDSSEAYFLSGMMSSMIRKLRRSSGAAAVSLPSRSSTPRPTNRLSNAVWWQALLYVSSFLLTWPIYFVANFNATREDYAFWLILAILNPLQGFWNCLIYFRPRLAECWNTFRSKRTARRNEAKKTFKPETQAASDVAPSNRTSSQIPDYDPERVLGAEDDGDPEEKKEENGGLPGDDNKAGVEETSKEWRVKDK
jgi:hypothetical protein